MSNDVIVDIFPGPSGSLWLATWGGGLNHFDPVTGEFSHFRNAEGDPTTISSDTIWLIFEDSQGIFWIGTDAGLNTFDPQTGRFIRYLNDPADPYSLSNDLIVGLFEDSSSRLWVGTRKFMSEMNAW